VTLGVEEEGKPEKEKGKLNPQVHAEKRAGCGVAVRRPE
jgi:hypothetical protein